MQPDRRVQQGRNAQPAPDEETPSREEEADETRSGRPMPEEDAADRTEHHKGSYGGEHGAPRERSEPPRAPERDRTGK